MNPVDHPSLPAPFILRRTTFLHFVPTFRIFYSLKFAIVYLCTYNMYLINNRYDLSSRPARRKFLHDARGFSFRLHATRVPVTVIIIYYVMFIDRVHVFDVPWL